MNSSTRFLTPAPRANVITSLSPEAVGVQLAALAGSAPASAAWQTGNAAIYIPFVVNEAMIVTQLFILNGGTATGNLDLGLYNADTLVKIVSAGSTGQSGTDAIQALNTTDVTLIPGRYLFGVAMDGTSGTVWSVTATVSLLRVLGLGRQTSAFPLPDPAVPAAMATHDKVPVVGLTARSFV